jgi:hypothetical protein
MLIKNAPRWKLGQTALIDHLEEIPAVFKNGMVGFL